MEDMGSRIVFYDTHLESGFVKRPLVSQNACVKVFNGNTFVLTKVSQLEFDSEVQTAEVYEPCILTSRSFSHIEIGKIFGLALVGKLEDFSFQTADDVLAILEENGIVDHKLTIQDYLKTSFEVSDARKVRYTNAIAFGLVSTILDNCTSEIEDRLDYFLGTDTRRFEFVCVLLSKMGIEHNTTRVDYNYTISISEYFRESFCADCDTYTRYRILCALPRRVVYGTKKVYCIMEMPLEESKFAPGFNRGLVVYADPEEYKTQYFH